MVPVDFVVASKHCVDCGVELDVGLSFWLDVDLVESGFVGFVGETASFVEVVLTRHLSSCLCLISSFEQPLKNFGWVCCSVDVVLFHVVEVVASVLLVAEYHAAHMFVVSF